MAVIHAPASPCARCSVCGVQRQFHFQSDVPHSRDRDHEFLAETIRDFDPGDLTPAQLCDAIGGAVLRSEALTNKDPVFDAEWEEASRHDARAELCRTELKARVRTVFGVTWDELVGAVE